MALLKHYRRFARVAKHSLPAVGFVGFAAAMFLFFLPPISRLDIKPTKTPAPIKQQVVKPKPKPAPAPKPQPAPAPKPQPAPTVSEPKAVAPAPTPQPAPVKTSPTSSVSNLQSAPPPATSTSSTSSSTSGSSGSPTLAPATATYSSNNWSGYFAVNSKFTTVSGSWIAPTPTGNGSTTSADATWIGIGGITTSDLIQVGTDNTVSPSGQVSTSAFYEMLPAAATTINSLKVSPGDSIQASVSEVSSGNWTITITDTTTNQTFTINEAYTSSLSSAEWIEEDPADLSGNLIPFDDFGTVTFSQGKTTDNGSLLTIAQASADSVEMVNSSSKPMATPSVLASDGETFNVVWQSQ